MRKTHDNKNFVRRSQTVIAVIEVRQVFHGDDFEDNSIASPPNCEGSGRRSAQKIT